MPSYTDITKLSGILSALRDPWDHHGDDVAKYAVVLADSLKLPKNQVELIAVGANLHDIGKLVLRRDLLNLPRKLELEEREQMEQHVVRGWEIVEQAGYDTIIRQIVRSHHERWDGRGYPDHLKGDEIPIGAQIVGVADTYSALISNRAYRDGYSHNFAQAFMQKGKTTQFNPMLVDLFFEKVNFRL